MFYLYLYLYDILAHTAAHNVQKRRKDVSPARGGSPHVLHLIGDIQKQPLGIFPTDTRVGD